MTQHQPFVPWALGLGGLIPFWGLAVGIGTGQTFGLAPSATSFALAAYAATIASFLGGIRWASAMREPQSEKAWADYALSVLPQLLAWSALALPDRQRLVTLAALIIAMGPLDRSLVRRGAAPSWFGRLRLVLSLGAGAALLFAATA